MNPSDISTSLKQAFPETLVNEVIETYSEMKRNLYLDSLRPNEVEGGRFAEAVFRLLEFATTGANTPLGQPLATESVIRALANTPSGSFSDSLRLHIPRTLRVIYDIRSKRDAAHLGDGIDPNLQDATIVSSCCDWVMAELVRLYHGTTADEAQKIIDDLVTRKVPAVQEFGDHLKTLRPEFSLNERLLIMLYRRGKRGATREELSQWVKPSQQKQLRTALWKLVHDKDLVFEANGIFQLTIRGEREVESKKLLDFD